MKFKSVVMRFVKGAVSGAVAQMGMVTLSQPAIWGDFKPLLINLGMACAFGSLVGLLLALQKWASWEDEDYL